jgi:hypothetical protein
MLISCDAASARKKTLPAALTPAIAALPSRETKYRL